MEKKDRIHSWLKNIYGLEEVPSYDVENPDCLNYLEALMELTEEEDQGMELISQLQIHQTAEFMQEASKLSQRLDNLGSFDRKGVVRSHSSDKIEDIDNAVDILANMAETLGIDDPSESTMNLALADLRHRVSKVPLENYINDKDYNKSKTDLFNDLKLLNKSERELTNARTEGKIDEDSIISTRKNYNWMQDKQKEYLRTQDKYVTTIRKNGFDKSHSHEAIVNQKKKLEDVIEKTKPIQSKIDGYKGLPASMELAQATLAEKEQLLHEMKQRLEKEVEKIRF